jgi:hypothetical protein
MYLHVFGSYKSNLSLSCQLHSGRVAQPVYGLLTSKGDLYVHNLSLCNLNLVLTTEQTSHRCKCGPLWDEGERNDEMLQGCQSRSVCVYLATTQEARHTTSRKTPTFWACCHATHRVEAVFRTVARDGEAQKTQERRCASADVFLAASVTHQSNDVLKTRLGAWLQVTRAGQLYTLSESFSSFDRMTQWPIPCIHPSDSCLPNSPMMPTLCTRIH